MTEDATLWADRFAPVTSKIGFLRASLEEATAAFSSWRRDIYGTVRVEHLPGGLRDHVSALEPLTKAVRPRELLVATADPEWTAVFDCGYFGGDPIASVGHLTRTLGREGVVVASIPASPVPAGSSSSPGMYGARQLEMFAPHPTHFLNYVRSISVAQDGRRWRFDANGVVQEFEDLDAYRRRRIQERFTSEMLIAYSAALGLKPFDEEFYPGPSVLLRNPAVPPAGYASSLQEVRRQLRMIPT